MIKNSYKNKIGIIVQCRINSSRLKNKLLLKIGRYTIIEILLKRLKTINNVSLVCAIAKEKNNYKLKKIIKKNNVEIYEGSKSNVLKRFYDLSVKKKFNIIIRITSDCPLIDPALIEEGLKKFKSKKIDYLSNNLHQTWPQGLDFEIFSFKSLKESFMRSNTNSQKEHVSEYLRSNKKIKKFNLRNPNNLKRYFRWTIDTKMDYKFFKKLFKERPSLIKDYRWYNLYNYLNKNYYIQRINASTHHFYFKN